LVSALVRAATSYEKARLLVAAGAKFRVRTALGNTPLILAARHVGNSRTVQLLLESGAIATERNEAGVSPVLSGGAAACLDRSRRGLAGRRVDHLAKGRTATVTVCYPVRCMGRGVAPRPDRFPARLLAFLPPADSRSPARIA
jgi:hypothetical protein